MKAYVVAYLVVLAILVQILLSALGVLPALRKDGQDPSGFVVPLAIFGVLTLAIIVAAARWHRAPRRPWFWVLGVIPAFMFFLPDVPILLQAATAPESIIDVVLVITVIGSLAVLLVAAILSFRDARRLAGMG